MKSNRLLKNCAIFIIAPFLAWGLLFMVNDFSALTASVLDITEVQKVKEEGWDVAYKTENQTLELFGSEKVQSADKIDVDILYNPTQIVIFPENASGENFRILTNEEGLFEVEITELNDRNYEEGWFEIPYSGDSSQILLGDSRKQEKEERVSLSVGNLNKNEEHSILP